MQCQLWPSHIARLMSGICRAQWIFLVPPSSPHFFGATTDRTPARDRTESVSKQDFFSADVAATTGWRSAGHRKEYARYPSRRVRREEAVHILAEISDRVPAEFRSSSGRASAGDPYIGQPPVLYFPRLCPTQARAWSELGRCPLKRTLSFDCLRCTGHRTILGRALADVFSDVVTMRELGESPVKFSSEVKISPSCHR